MGTSMSPSAADYEDLFGPAGREVKSDSQRHKRVQRWHLPDVLKGANNFLTDRVDGLISDATDSPFTSAILPYQYVENPDQKLSWDVWSYDEGLASRVPYESAARVLTQSKSTHSAYIVRQGLAISMEHNFMMSERGRRDFNNQLLQLVGSIQYTNDLDVHMALITAPNYERTEVEKYAYSDSDPTQVLRKYVDMFGMCQKNPNGLDVLIEDAREVFKKWGASEPSFMLTNSKLGYQQNMTLEKTQYLTNGVDGIKRLKSGPDLKSYRGLNVINSRHFSMEAGRQPRDLLNRRVRVAEHYKLPPYTATELSQNTVLLYDQGRDQMAPVSCKDLYDSSRLVYPPGVRGDNDPEFEEILALEKDKENIPKTFWNHLFWNPEDIGASEAASKSVFDNWVAMPPTRADKLSAYHPMFIKKYNQARATIAGRTGDAAFTHIMTMTNQDFDQTHITNNEYVRVMSSIFDFSEPDQLRMQAWLKFIGASRYQELPAGKETLHGVCHGASRLNAADIRLVATDVAGFDNDARTFLFWFYNTQFDGADGRPTEWKEGGGAPVAGDRKMGVTPENVAYCMMMPHIAKGYSRCQDIDSLFVGGDAKAGSKKYSLMVVRPSIEHYMLGVIIGRGGTGELGATLWGQTELSCYDDAMHGKWGMNYKYHARAVVFNEKHLLRLWDIAFNGYTGGMGMKRVDWDRNSEGWNAWAEASVDLSEPLRSSFPDMFVMQFESQPKLDDDLPNPINFCCDAVEGASSTMIDAENIHKTHSKEMDIFLDDDPRGGGVMNPANAARYREYKDRMPPYANMHKQRKAAGHASHEGDTHTASLSFSGTMIVKNQHGAVILDQHGTGHLGDSFAGSSSIRAGHGSMAATSRPTMQRIV
jgi:hypothetical protein